MQPTNVSAAGMQAALGGLTGRQAYHLEAHGTESALDLSVVSFRTKERIGKPYRVVIRLTHPLTLSCADYLGKPATFRITPAGGIHGTLNGRVTAPDRYKYPYLTQQGRHTVRFDLDVDEWSPGGIVNGTPGDIRERAHVGPPPPGRLRPCRRRRCQRRTWISVMSRPSPVSPDKQACNVPTLPSSPSPVPPPSAIQSC